MTAIWWKCSVATIVIIVNLHCIYAEDTPDKNEPITGKMKPTNTWEAYRALLETQRKAHMEVVKHLLVIGHTEKQYDMLALIMKKMVEVLEESKGVLIAAEFSATDEFPQNEVLRDELSKLIQNGLLFGDLALRFPIFVHRIYDKDEAARKLIKWCFDFINTTGVTKGTTAAQTVHLASQELNIIEREPNFENPFQEDLEVKLSRFIEEEMKNEKKLKKKKKRPQLSARTEL